MTDDVRVQQNQLLVNKRSYAWPTKPTVVICFDGCDPKYIKCAEDAGVIPNLQHIKQNGFSVEASANIPSFTNPNNMSIVAGAPPSVHGVSGNFYLDRDSGEVVMMTGNEPVRAPTILAKFSQAGARVAAITAKDKLRKALGAGLDGVCFSAEQADHCTETDNGIANVPALVGRPAPETYSADLSLYVLDAGIALLKREQFDLMYLSLSDFVQHSHAEGTTEANRFMQEFDSRLGQLIAADAIVGVVADHGMTDMSNEDGSPNVVFLGDLLDEAFGPDVLKVICPITDPYVRHHGALGSFARVHILGSGVNPDDVLAYVRNLPKIELALTRDEVCSKHSLPPDREGDIAVFTCQGVAIGGRQSEHDLSQLAGARLRSHGGRHEQDIPFLVSCPVNPSYVEKARGQLYNHDIFDYVLNGPEAGS